MPIVLSKPLSGPQYVALAEFRYQLRTYLRHMEGQARANGNHPQQYQLLLAIKGLPEPKVPTISTLAERMQMNHNSMVELVNRCEKRGLLRRTRSSQDRRWVSLAITPKGDMVLRQQASASRRELLTIGPVLVETLQSLIDNRSREDSPRKAGSKK
jgi:DNA-binding MarR family transcriptional regulator